MEMQQSLTHLATLHTILLAGLFLAGLAMGIWSVLELQALRPEVLHGQISAEQSADAACPRPTHG